MYLLVPLLADNIERKFNRLDFFVKVFVHVYFKHLVSAGYDLFKSKKITRTRNNEHNIFCPVPKYIRIWPLLGSLHDRLYHLPCFTERSSSGFEICII